MEKSKDTEVEAQSMPVGIAPNPQRKYKDRLFRMIFQDKKELLSLYNAVNGTDHDDPDQLTINTLENAIYMNMKNDTSFVLHSELNLYEHQSTFNPNMPLRDLFYVARELEKLTAQRTLYSSARIQIPVPRFVVFYNGREDQPERSVWKLSDAYEKPMKEPELELKVLMLNINLGRNSAIMEKCRALREYMLYVARVREYAAEGDIRTAVDRAVRECISEGILRDFLLKNRAEAISMSIFEYDEEREKELLKKEYLEEGNQSGKAESILTLLSELGEIPEKLKETICVQQDSEILKIWLRLAAKANSVEEFQQNMI